MSGEGNSDNGGEGNPDSKTLEERLKVLEEQNQNLQGTNERLLKQSQEWKGEAQKHKESEVARAKVLEDEREKKLREQGEYKQLLTQREEALKLKDVELEEEKKKSRLANDTLLEARKLSAFENKLGGRLKNDKYLSFVNTQGIVIDPETGDLDSASVESTVKNFLGEHKELVNFQAGRMPNYAGGSNGNVSAKEWKGMTLKDKYKNLSSAVEADRKTRK